MVEVDTVDAVVAALVRPARVLGAGPQPHPRPGSTCRSGSFISEFDGLSGSAKQKAIRAVVPGVTHLSGLDGRDDLIAALHDAMLDHAKPTQPKRLGPVGRGPPPAPARRRVRRGAAVVQVHRDRRRRDPVDHRGRRRRHRQAGPHLVRVQPCARVRRPAGPPELEAGDVYATGAESFLKEADANQRRGRNRAAVVHVICAAAAVHGQGQGHARRPATRRGPRGERRWTKPPRRCGRRPSSGARTPARPNGPSSGARRGRAQGERQNQWTIKDAVFEVLLEAKAAAGHIVATRTLYYKVRPLVQEYTDKELNYEYFSQTLLPEYERDHAPLQGLYYEARGELHHPHDGTVTPLGTREVEALQAAAVAVRQGALHREDGPGGPARALPARSEVRHGHHLREGLRR